VCVVNIDNGFGAAYVAAMMVRAQSSERPEQSRELDVAEAGNGSATSSHHR
jgi:hypothetical protein